MATNIIHLKCQSCGAPLEIDSSNLIAYCPHCGQKLLFDVDQIGSILLEKEKTKQKEIDHDLEVKRINNERIRIENEKKRNKDKSDNAVFIVGLIFMFLLMGLIVVAIIFTS